MQFMDWVIMGQKMLGLNGEAYALVLLDIGSDIGAVINTRTREDPWQHWDELAALWGHTPKAIRGDGAAEFEHSADFKACRRKHHVAFNPVETYRHTMQGHIENFVKQVKVHSRCILKHAHLPARFWSETTTMYVSVRNIMPTDKMLVPFTAAQPHRLRFDPKLLLHRPGCLVAVKNPKDHPRVTDTSNGAGRVWHLDPSCMPDRQGFSDKDIEALHKPNNCRATRASPRTPAESALPASVSARCTQPIMTHQHPSLTCRPSAAGDGDADLIQEASDKALATFSSKRKLLIDLGKDA